MCIHTPFLCIHLLRVIFRCRLLHSNVCKVNIMVVDRIQGKSSVWESSKSTPIQPCLVGKNFWEKSLSPEERRFCDSDMPWWQYWARAFKGGEGVRKFLKLMIIFLTVISTVWCSARKCLMLVIGTTLFQKDSIATCMQLCAVTALVTGWLVGDAFFYHSLVVLTPQFMPNCKRSFIWP